MKMKAIYDAIYVKEKDIFRDPKIIEQYIIDALNRYIYLILEINKIDNISIILNLLKSNKINEGRIYCICKENNKIYFDYMNYRFNNENEYTKDYLEKYMDIKNIFYFKGKNYDVKNVFVPLVSNRENEKEKYALKLAKYYQIAREKNKIEEKKYVEKFNSSHMFCVDSFNELYDRKLGAIIIEDSDFILLNENNSNHPLIEIFELNCMKNKLRYSCNQDNNIILRGPQNYYYYMCYIGEYSSKEMKEVVLQIKFFLNNALEILRRTNINPKEEIMDLKLVLALLDILKNTTTNNIYYYVRKNVVKESTVVIYDLLNKKESVLYKSYILLKKIYSNLYDVLFLEKSEFDVGKLICDIETEIEIQDDFIKDIKDETEIDYRKILRLWRETDNIIENIITFSSVIDNIKENQNEHSKNLLLLGLNYGSIDLAILASVICDKLNLESTNVGEIIVNLTYPEVYNSDLLNLEISNIFDMKFDEIKKIMNVLLLMII